MSRFYWMTESARWDKGVNSIGWCKRLRELKDITPWVPEDTFSEVATRLSRSAEPSGNLLEAVFLYLRIYLLSLHILYLWTWLNVLLRLLSNLVLLTQQSHLACPAVSFSLLNHITSPTQVWLGSASDVLTSENVWIFMVQKKDCISGNTSNQCNLQFSLI